MPKFQYLVVDHHMDCTICGIRGEFTQMERLINNSLSRKSSIAVHQNRHHLKNHIIGLKEAFCYHFLDSKSIVQKS